MADSRGRAVNMPRVFAYPGAKMENLQTEISKLFDKVREENIADFETIIVWAGINNITKRSRISRGYKITFGHNRSEKNIRNYAHD